MLTAVFLCSTLQQTKRKTSLNIYGGDAKPSPGLRETLHQRNAALIAKSLKQKELPGLPDARAHGTSPKHKMAAKDTKQAESTSKIPTDPARKTAGKPNLPEPRNKMAGSGAQQPNSKPQIPAGGSQHLPPPTTNQRPSLMAPTKERQQNSSPTRAYQAPRAPVAFAGGVLPPGLAQQKKAHLGGGGGQLPANLLSELSTVLSKTGRSPKDES